MLSQFLQFFGVTVSADGIYVKASGQLHCLRPETGFSCLDSLAECFL